MQFLRLHKKGGEIAMKYEKLMAVIVLSATAAIHGELKGYYPLLDNLPEHTNGGAYEADK